LQQLVVKADQFLLQQFYPSPGTKSDGQLSAMVHGVDAVITGTHEEDKQGGTGDVIRVSFIVVGTFLHEVDPSSGMFLQRDVFVRFGNAAGSLTTTKGGAIPAMPSMVEIQNCIASIPLL
jgi:hypothetical protein